MEKIDKNNIDRFFDMWSSKTTEKKSKMRPTTPTETYERMKKTVDLSGAGEELRSKPPITYKRRMRRDKMKRNEESPPVEPLVTLGKDDRISKLKNAVKNLKR